LQKLEKRDHLAEIKDLDFAFQHHPISGKWVFEAKNLTFGYGSDNIIREFSFPLEKNEKIAIIGKNGKGKSTLIRILSGELTPRDGEITMHPQATVGYFGQTNRDTLTPHLTVEEEINTVLAIPSRERARSIAGSMLFEGEMSQKKVEVLSGGERARVMLAKIIATPCSLLLLDEPTNHLDMQSADALLEALDQFDGALVMVTHNEMFLRSIPTKLIVFDDNGTGPDGKSFPYIFHGTYDEFLEQLGWSDERVNSMEPVRKISAETVINKKDLRKIRADIIEEKNRTLNPLKKQMDSLEAEIVSHENLIDRNNHALIEAASKSDTEALRTLGASISESKSKLDSLYNDLEAVTVEYETQTEYYREKILPYDSTVSTGE